jgi:hypothetical protein
MVTDRVPRVWKVYSSDHDNPDVNEENARIAIVAEEIILLHVNIDGNTAVILQSVNYEINISLSALAKLLELFLQGKDAPLDLIARVQQW